MIFGYARVSTKDQSLQLQIDALTTAGVPLENIYKDIASGSSADRKNLNELLSKLRNDDVLIVWKLDRVARSVSHLIKLLDQFGQSGIHFRSIQENFIDTSSSYGKFLFNVFSSFAQLERDIIVERTKAGLESARQRGRIGGRPMGLNPDAQKKAKVCEALYTEGKLTVNEILKITEISKRTFYNYLRYRGVEIGTAVVVSASRSDHTGKKIKKGTLKDLSD